VYINQIGIIPKAIRLAAGGFFHAQNFYKYKSVILHVFKNKMYFQHLKRNSI